VVPDEQAIDAQLVAVLIQVLDAVYQAKQVAWSASTSPFRENLRELVAFLIDESGRLMVAEERIDGRSPDVSSPSSHQRGNLVAESHGDHGEAVARLAERLAALAIDVRARAAVIPGAAETSMLSELADGLEARLGRLSAG
jgi:hypothetical protein